MSQPKPFTPQMSEVEPIAAGSSSTERCDLDAERTPPLDLEPIETAYERWVNGPVGAVRVDALWNALDEWIPALIAEVESLRMDVATERSVRADQERHSGQALVAWEESKAENAALVGELERTRAALDDMARENIGLAAMLAAERATSQQLRDAILDIDAHSAPLGKDDDGFVSVGYAISVGCLHRALGLVGHSAAPAQDAETETIARLGREDA